MKQDCKYKIIKKEEKDEDSLIENVFTQRCEFTLKDVKTDIDSLLKRKIELEAQSKVKEALMTNIETHHPEVKDINEKTKVAVALWQTAKQEKKIYDDDLKVIDERLGIYAQDIQDVLKQTGLHFEQVEDIKPKNIVK